MDTSPPPEDTAPPPPTGTARFALSSTSAFLLLGDGRFYSSADTSEGVTGRFGQLGSPRAPAPEYGFAAYEGPHRFDDIGAALLATCGRVRDPERSMYCWGRNSRGILGIGSSDNGRTELEPIRAEVERVSVIEAGQSHGCLLDDEGLLYCWGANGSGQLGSGLRIIVARPSPTVVEPDARWTALSTSYDHNCAVRDDGALFCWGSGRDGQLGNGAMESQWAPVRIGSATDWTSVSAGVAHTCGIRGLADSARLFCWGRNTSGEIGLPPGVVAVEPTEVDGTGWTAVSTGQFHTCALRDEEGITTAYCFGAGHRGELGVIGVRNSDTPVRIESPTQWTSIVASWRYTCGVARGRYYCWGDTSEVPFQEGFLVGEPTEIRLEPPP